MQIALHQFGNDLRCSGSLWMVLFEHILHTNQFNVSEETTACAYSHTKRGGEIDTQKEEVVR